MNMSRTSGVNMCECSEYECRLAWCTRATNGLVSHNSRQQVSDRRSANVRLGRQQCGGTRQQHESKQQTAV